MAFVKQHHPELIQILNTLKAGDPRGYQRAVRDLHRTSERLISIRERVPQRYDLELKIWKAKSRSALLATRYKMTKDDSIRKELRSVVDSQIDLQLELLKRDVARHQERLDKLNKQMRDLNKARKQLVEKQVRVLTQQRKSRNDSKNKKSRRKSKTDTPKKTGQ